MTKINAHYKLSRLVVEVGQGEGVVGVVTVRWDFLELEECMGWVSLVIDDFERLGVGDNHSEGEERGGLGEVKLHLGKGYFFKEFDLELSH